jgi:hypothetical protein
MLLFRLSRCSVILFLCLDKFELGGSIPRVARWSRGEGEGPYPRGGVGSLWLARLFRLAARAPPEFARGLGRGVLSTLADFCKKMGPFLGGGMPPIVAPEGDLVFWGKPCCPFDFINFERVYIYTANWSVGYVIYKNNLEILSKGRSDVTVGCSKRW